MVGGWRTEGRWRDGRSTRERVMNDVTEASDVTRDGEDSPETAKTSRRERWVHVAKSYETRRPLCILSLSDESGSWNCTPNNSGPYPTPHHSMNSVLQNFVIRDKTLEAATYTHSQAPPSHAQPPPLSPRNLKRATVEKRNPSSRIPPVDLLLLYPPSPPRKMQFPIQNTHVMHASPISPSLNLKCKNPQPTPQHPRHHHPR